MSDETLAEREAALSAGWEARADIAEAEGDRLADVADQAADDARQRLTPNAIERVETLADVLAERGRLRAEVAANDDLLDLLQDGEGELRERMADVLADRDRLRAAGAAAAMVLNLIDTTVPGQLLKGVEARDEVALLREKLIALGPDRIDDMGAPGEGR